MDYLTHLEFLCLHYGKAATARRLGVCDKTLYRWRHQQARPSGFLPRLITLEAMQSRGELSSITQHPTWQGWTIARDGLLYDPAGNAFSAPELSAYLWRRVNGAA